MYLNQNRKNHNNKYSHGIENKTYCCQSPNTCIIPYRTEADKNLLKQFYELNGYEQKNTECIICKNVNLIN